MLNHIAARLDEVYPNRITSEDFFKYSSIQKLAKYICGIEEESSKYSKHDDSSKNTNDNKRSDIAIIGMSAILSIP
ncbi:hypothetical protein D3C76_1038850 [compost metagenome]